MNIFSQQIAIILVLASVLAIIFRLLKQPTVLAYIFTGLILGGMTFFDAESKDSIKALSEIGITLLLFLLGLELNLGELRSVGKISLVTGIAQIIFTTTFGFLINILLGIQPVTSFIISFAITFSSTIIIVKLLSDKKEINSLYGKISIGFLLVQDFVAVVALILFTSIGNAQSMSFVDITLVIFKAVGLFVLVVLLSKTIIPVLVNYISHNSEILFLASISWALALAFLVSSPILGFSIEIGGFLAGLSLANTIQTTYIVSKVKALRDFFIVIFFVLLGAGMQFGDLSSVLFPAIVLSLFVLIGNPLIVMVILGYFGYKTRTSFFAGLTVAQISEFSIILIYLGERLGFVDSKYVTMITIIGIITFTVSTYLINYNNYVYKLLSKYLSVFEKRNTIESNFNLVLNKHFDIVLIGSHRMGGAIVDVFSKDQEEKQKLLIVDFNPDLIDTLKRDGFNVLFGDIADIEVLDKIYSTNPKVIISTVPSFEENMILCKYFEDKSIDKIILTAHEDADVSSLKAINKKIEILMPYQYTGRNFGKKLSKLIKSENINIYD